MSRIAVMGSAFNPPSLGHKDVVEQALKQCDQVWLVPAFRHAWGKKMAAYLEKAKTALDKEDQYLIFTVVKWSLEVILLL